MLKNLVVINEKHTILESQKKILDEKYQKWEFLKVPATGWTRKQIENIKLVGNNFIFVSPVPLLLAKAVYGGAQNAPIGVSLFFSEKRNALEKNGILSHQIQNEWQLIDIA